MWINQGDIILVGLRDYQDAKADVILKYNADEARNLKTYGEIPDSVKVTDTGFVNDDLDDDDEGYPATLNVATSRSTQNVVGNEMSSSHRDVSDPMSLDSGVITTLSR